MPNLPIVLVIDDEIMAREAIEALLAAEHCHLEFAVDGPSGLARAEELEPDLILLDLMMPGMDGFEVCRRLRAHPRLAEVPVVIVTALDEPEARLQGLEAGADDFIGKPFNRLELRARLRSILRLNRYRRLQVERTRLAWVLEQAHDGYLLLDAEDHLLYANTKARFYLDLPAGKDLPQAAFLALARRRYVLHPDAAWQDWPKQQEPLPRYLLCPESPTAPVFWLQVEELSSGDVDQFGRVVQLRDVTQQITSQLDMRKFHTALMHKLRTPLSIIHNSLYLLKQHAEEMSPRELAEMANAAASGITRLDSQLNDIFGYLSISRLSQVENFFALAQLERETKRIAREVGIGELTVTLPTALQTASLSLPASHMELILYELLENAHKFHPRHTPAITLEASLDAQTVRLTLADNGIHLSPQQLTWAFMPYTQGEKYFTGEVPGMGLGLPLVSTLVWQAGGKVNLHNRDDRPGIVVNLHLPLAEAANSASVDKADELRQAIVKSALIRG
jgi:DNA-binding response OmpR family regulator/anti-sigma regulatory factor (Ser/Thr protein kinase)